ncbi:MAG: hypothetical protein DWQ47_06035 [Acidobacteria bacterium]|nr:MAG: hypothetical protein DWQ32_09585 [Acidobacteriota bacterium]REK01938.1 MAG: hypothetical protein DWQ38_06020 [Acidobacteriota bacterium]REK14894.1 MAG: hypothetical protein DWQ43_15275 [Acidobacteriota bacterium]REK45609.1 MAG: hypothetical protein DWQ47_06035 [Acidobacteriota bacterium]
MSFNKTKSMRNAERYLTNGKIEAAISEYKQIVRHDPSDITTQNILGDLFVKALKTDDAVSCYLKVAEHYNDQGFAKKAIAVYNKIYKLVPDSTEIVGKLGELYHFRGSVAEARAHYKIFAERLEKEGKASEVLEVWQKLADLDKKDPSICLKLAEAFRERNQKDDACKTYFEAGSRLAEQGDHAGAVEAFGKALKVNERFVKAVRGLVRAHFLLGTPEEAARLLEERLEEDQYNKDLIFLLIDCYFEMKDAPSAERVITKLIEREPANYPKLLDLVDIYLETKDPDSAVRILSMVSEHLLAGGDAEILESHLKNLLEADPENIDGLRLLARCYGWLKEQQKLKDTLISMADAAHSAGQNADERWAISQYLVLVPHDSARTSRLEELVEAIGPEDSEEELISSDHEEIEASGETDGLGLESEAEFAAVNEGTGLITHGKDGSDEIIQGTIIDDPGVVTIADENVSVVGGSLSSNGSSNGAVEQDYVTTRLSPGDEVRLDEEIVSINFYIEQGYDQLADKAFRALEKEFGNRKEIAELRVELYESDTKGSRSVKQASPSLVPDPESRTGNEQELEQSILGNEDVPADPDPISEIASDLGLDETQTADPEDFEEHYNRGVVYKEMGILEEAIRGFQDAIECLGGKDNGEQFYNACTMLGHCFMEQNMPKLAIIWFKRAYEECDLGPEEKQGLDYELGNAFELLDKPAEAMDHFERVYAVDVDFRDVAERLEDLREKETVAG